MAASDADVPVPAQLAGRVEAWIADDPDESTRDELRDLLNRAADDKEALADLDDRFTGTLEFGTAGLRGRLAAGPNRMNRAVVTRAAAGLADFLLTEGNDGGEAPGGVSSGATDAAAAGAPRVVIGYDARHLSDVFARDTAEVLSGAGLDAVMLPRPLPTPLLAFGVRHLGCVAGVMVTASHNPPRDNGYKVYLADGSQVSSPDDADIASRIAAVHSISGVPRAGGWTQLDETIVDDYVAAVATLAHPTESDDITVVHTALHGVGDDTVRRVLAAAGFAPLTPVPEQAVPDADFPTVSFPNPEEPGAMDLAMALAERQQADLVVANDPDADRCAVAVPTVQGWRMLSGDEVGVLLADHLIRKGVTGTFVTTIVSSSLLARMAAREGVDYQQTLTGFKWIGRVPGLVFGYEEALGYCVAPHLVRDKDGVSALLLVVELAAELAADGRTLLDRLDELAGRYGVHATGQVSVRVADRRLIQAAMQRLRQRPPAALGGLTVDTVDDLAEGVDGLPPTDGLRYRLTGGGRVVVRPSGTEPKLKCYLEVVVDVDEPGVAAARIAAAGRLDAIRADMAAAVGG